MSINLTHLVQAPQFRCGGFAVGTVVNHGLMNGFALQEFAKNLTHVARKGDVAFIPLTDRTYLKSRFPLRIKYEHEKLVQPSQLGADSSPFMERNMNLLRNKVVLHNQSEKHVFKLFTLSGKSLGLLKLKAKEGGVSHCSSFIVAMAQLWRARTAAMANINADDITRVHYVVDMRSRMRPPLPREYAGNATKAAYAKATAKELLDQPFSATVKMLEEAGNRLSDEYLRSAIDWLELHDGVMRMENGFVVTSWSRTEYRDVEFGGEVKSICAGPVVSGRKGIVAFMADAKDKAGIKTHIRLEPSHVARFRILFQNVDTDTTIRSNI
ncbi:acyltransferase GLAUCE-like [Cryptomeria japonica]|uniref:acyltransferase GLAUCE-like n=1 Tax=Cryptomeria japonica TaxID=3369 RepID=UPI0027DA35A9|nr:acyltransferase GLAUCE-like [Cryptomeria japonica]